MSRRRNSCCDDSGSLVFPDHSSFNQNSCRALTDDKPADCFRNPSRQPPAVVASLWLECHSTRETRARGVAGNNPEEWRKTVLMTPARQLYLLDTYLFSSLRDAARFIKRGRSLQIAVASTLQVQEQNLLIQDRFVPEQPELVERGQLTESIPETYLYVEGVKNPSTGKRNIRYRVATAPGWRCQCTLLWDKTIVSRGEMEALCLTAGQFVGVGDGRAIGFGRFTVPQFEVADTS